MKIENMILRENMPPSIKNMYTNIIEDAKWKHCIHDYMLEIYKNKYSLKTLQKLNTTNDIYNFCVEKHIKMIAYDINGNCIKANYPNENKSRLKNLFFITKLFGNFYNVVRFRQGKPFEVCGVWQRTINRSQFFNWRIEIIKSFVN